MQSFARLPDEPEDAFKLFLIYRNTDPHLRDLDALADQTSLDRHYLYHLAEKFEWRDRAAAFDLSRVNAYQQTSAIYCARAQAELMKTIALTLARISEALDPLDMRYASLDEFQKITTFLSKLIVPTKKVLETANLTTLEPEINSILSEARKLTPISPPDDEDIKNLKKELNLEDDDEP